MTNKSDFITQPRHLSIADPRRTYARDWPAVPPSNAALSRLHAELVRLQRSGPQLAYAGYLVLAQAAGIQRKFR